MDWKAEARGRDVKKRRVDPVRSAASPQINKLKGAATSRHRTEIIKFEWTLNRLSSLTAMNGEKMWRETCTKHVAHKLRVVFPPHI